MITDFRFLLVLFAALGLWGLAVMPFFEIDKIEGWAGGFAAIVALLGSIAVAVLANIWISRFGTAYYRRSIRPAPWEKPFPVSRAEPDVFDALLARLDLIEERPSEWASILRDRETGQVWRQQSHEKGSDVLEPVVGESDST